MARNSTIVLDDLSPELRSYIEGLESENTDLAKTLSDATDTIERLAIDLDDDTDDDDGVEGLLKSADPKLVAIVNSAQDAAEAATKRANEAIEKADREADIRLTAEHVAKAASLDALGADNAKLGQALRSIAKSDKDAYETVWSVLTAANEAVQKSGLFGEKGNSNANDSDDAQSEVMKRATALIAKSEGKLGFTEAVAQVVADDPKLYSDYRKGA